MVNRRHSASLGSSEVLASFAAANCVSIAVAAPAAPRSVLSVPVPQRICRLAVFADQWCNRICVTGLLQSGTCSLILKFYRESLKLMGSTIRRTLESMSLLLPVAVLAPPAEKPEAMPVAATIETSLETDSTHIRQFAFDGDPGTFFASAQDARRADHFTLIFESPVAIESIAIATGRPDGSDRLKAVSIELSTDGTTFDPPRPLADSEKLSDPIGPKLKAVRFKPLADLKHPLAIREVTIASVPEVAVFQYPVEFVVNVADAPEMKAWAERTARICEGAYAMMNRELKSDGFKPPSLIKMSLKKNYRGVAAAGGGEITGSVRWFKEHPRDVGAMVHETVHIVQAYHHRGNPSWLVEGVADYLRFFKFEPGNLGPINAQRAHYNQSYRVERSVSGLPGREI